MFVNADFSDLLNLFKANNVKYLVIGGYAVVQYTEPRFTKDLDLWISTQPDNAEAVFKTLKEFGAPLEGMIPQDFSEEGCFYQMGIPPVRVDILMGIPGVQFDDISVTIISKQDLILAKRAAGRPQDLLDADSLEQASE